MAKGKKLDSNLIIGETSLDLISVFEKRFIDEMDDAELETRIVKLQQLRRLRVPTSKKKTLLEQYCINLTVEKAREVLDQMRIKDELDKQNQPTSNNEVV